MGERRRRVLQTLGAVGVVGVAGCSGLGGEATTTATDDTSADAATDDGTGTPTVTPTTTLASTTATAAPTDAETGSETTTASDTTTRTTTDTATRTTTDTATRTTTDTATATATRADPGPLTAEARKVAASDGDARDGFGSAVATSGDGRTAVVGAPFDEDPHGTQGGSAYVFRRTDGSWNEAAKLAATDGDGFDLFGGAVAVSGDGATVLVGAERDEDPNGGQGGAAYVFERVDGSWREDAKLAAPDGDDYDFFGSAVALAGDGARALVGARFDEDPNGSEAGSAYVFERADGSWREDAKLAAPDGDAGDRFGLSVALSTDGARALVGADSADTASGDAAGAAYAFSRTNGSWGADGKLAAPDGDGDDWFGRSVALAGDGETALVGALGDENARGELAGSAYAFSRTNDGWGAGTKLLASDGETDDIFGSAVALSADGASALVGAAGDDGTDGPAAGIAYVFTHSDGGWRETARLAASDRDQDDFFGDAIAASADASTVLVGAPQDEDPNVGGSAYLFE